MPRSGKRDTALLGALLADARTDTTDEDIAATTEMFFDAIPGGKLIPIERVHEWGGQPRKAFDETRLAELAASIAAAGVLEPLVVRRDPDRPGHYLVTAGMRRLLAARRVHGSDDPEARRQVAVLPCVIREVAEPEAFADALVENLVRQDLTRREVMDAVKTLKDQYGWSVREIARRTGRNDHDLSELIRVAEDAEVASLVAEEQLAVTAAGPLVQARNHALRGPVIDAIRAGRVRTLAQVEAALEEERRREHWTEGNQVRDPTHAAPSRAADVTDHAEKAEEPSGAHQVRDITHLTITEDGAVPTDVLDDAEPDAMSPPGGGAIPVKEHMRRVGASTRAEALARDILTFFNERPKLDRAARLKLREALDAAAAYLDATEGH